MKINRENVTIILVEPQHPGNIGAAARAMKTMGFENLRLVNPCDYTVPEVHFMGHASEDVLGKARVFPDLQAALADQHFVVATTQRIRELRMPTFTPAELGRKISDVSREHSVALVFGREKSGLTNEELRACHAISTIPAAVSHPSLNLSQAVMLYVYEFYQHSFSGNRRYRWNFADYRQKEQLYRHLRESLQRVEFVPRDNWDNFIMRFRRVFDRAVPEVRDVNLVHKILQAFDQYIEHKLHSGKE